MMTLRKISTITGFSVSTVSKALNNRLDINLETKKYIQDVAFKYNYIPNKNAISLRKNKSNIIAVILPQVNNSIYSEALFSMQKKASSLGYRVLLFQSLTDRKKEKRFLDEINDGSVDGAIVLSTSRKVYKEGANVIPVAYINVTAHNGLEEVKEQCMSNFKKLLNQIK